MLRESVGPKDKILMCYKNGSLTLFVDLRALYS